MREWCGCGAGIRTLRRRDAITWRNTHHCPDRPEDDGTHISAGAQVEHAGHRYYDGETPITQAIGFRIEETL